MQKNTVGYDLGLKGLSRQSVLGLHALSLSLYGLHLFQLQYH